MSIARARQMPKECRLEDFSQLNRVRKYKACENATSGAYSTYVSIVALSVTQ
ncbi:MAG: hypothetical protein IJ998_00815 [Alistipes sp.]|nr:hypothetical protein [Alistipes sp.]